jgi:protein-S-isoprenylcysteine O-methyltransferase Ste14
VLAALVALLEWRAGPRPVPGVLAVAGLALAATGLVLHRRARRALGSGWAVTVRSPEAGGLVVRGPYARVRHPIYLALLLVAAGTLVAHPSLATAALACGLAGGLARKIRSEEAALRAALGPEWERYAARVPALVPRLHAGPS